MPNRLAGETSPYLRQHRDNPVDWHPWGDEAFAEAAAADKPVLVSIGYSACHWCHVMAHESFEDPATAAVMNELFVNVKVDREERPDVDAIYMDATQAMTGHGGWPMTVFCAPDGRPFYCGTYFPPRARQGMPSFLDVCRAVTNAWRDRRADLLAQSDQLITSLGRSGLLSRGSAVPGIDVVNAAVATLLDEHDDERGGFGRAPKFPPTMGLDTLLRAHLRTGSSEPLAAVRTTLDAMAAGGMYDHLGGGFARYSVDDTWLVPHFEKMLYDQALLARAFLHAWQVTGDPGYRQVVEETIGYVLRDLRDAGGGFYSAEDADSEGVEGRFYVWTPDAIRAAVDGDVAMSAAAIEWYGVTDEGNFEGATILNRIAHRGELLRPPDVEAARRRLFDARQDRVRPGLDDKVLAEWNGLMVATLAEAAAALGRDDWLAEARRTAEFLLRSLRRQDGRWLRSWQADAGAKTLAFAADYGALADAFTRLAEATGEARWVTAAVETADALLALFWDDEDGGVFTSGHDGEKLVTRAKDVLDAATPSAGSLATVALLRLGALTGNDRYTARGNEVLALLGDVVTRHPTAFGHLLYAIELSTELTEVAVVGERPDLLATVRAAWRPMVVLAWGEPYDSPLWHDRADGLAYVCRNYTCQRPSATPQELAAQLTSPA